MDPAALASAYTTWEESGNMVSASVFRAFAHLAASERTREGDVGMFLAFGTGVACEMALLRWDSPPDIALSC
jgi:3-oxoacyl-[acyl-carrier-protein] synthase III